MIEKLNAKWMGKETFRKIFGFEGGMWGSIVLVPDLCQSIYFTQVTGIFSLTKTSLLFRAYFTFQNIFINYKLKI